MDDRGFFLTWQAVSKQLAAMPSELYLVRLIHAQSRRAFPGERLWSAGQLASARTIRFLRARNCEGCDVYLCPYAGDQNAGYILVDLDAAQPTALETMRALGHAPCVVLQTSPGHFQTWVCLRTGPLEPAVATAAGKWLASAYGGDPASTDWRHLGRLAGFTNQKPARRAFNGQAPWVRLVYARAGLAPQADSLLQSARAAAQLRPPAPHADTSLTSAITDPACFPYIAAAGQCHLPWLYAALEDRRTLFATRLEHRRSVGRPLPVVAGNAGDSGRDYSPARQPAFPPPSLSSRRLLAAHPRTCCFSRPSGRAV
jgi:hypothetical protein